MINTTTIVRIGRQQVLLRQLQDQAKQVATVRQPALVDSFNRPHTYLRISITERCNLRCQYCMPLEGVNLTPKAELLTENEIVRLAELFAEQGVNKIRFTGGEPLVSPQIVQLIERIKKIDGIDTIALTTNAVTLARKLPELVGAGLDAVNISLDTIVPQKFAFITRRPARTLQKILKGVDAALNSNLKSVKLNTVVMKGLNEDELCDFVALTKDSPLSVRFLEFMPFSGNAWENKKFIPFTAQKELIEQQYGDLEKRNDVPTSTSMNYGVEGHVGSVGFISSMSRNFCGGCNRLRLTHDGMLKVCLFGKDEVSLRDALRSNSANCEEDLLEVIHGAVKRKKYSHGGLSNIQSEMKRPMILIGG